MEGEIPTYPLQKLLGLFYEKKIIKCIHIPPLACVTEQNLMTSGLKINAWACSIPFC